MVLAYKGANRATGVTTDRIGTESYSAKSWVELGRTTLSSAGDSINVASLSTSDYPYMMVLVHGINSGQIQNNMRFNNDSGNNYANNYSNDGGNTNFTSQPYVVNSDTYTSDIFQTDFIMNKSDQEKIGTGQIVAQNATGAGTAPRRTEYGLKWANTSDSITSVSLINTGSGDYASGSEVVVLGYDPDDTEGTSVWEELASVDLSGGTGDSLSSGTISAKKYLWVQAYLEQSGSGDTGNICRLNSDSGSNYAIRYSENGGSDATSTSRTNIVTGANSGTDGAGEAFYINMFIINKSDKEKLIIGELNDTDAGSGAGTAPGRSEFVAKWANTSGQITNITWTNSGGSATWATTSRLKVWGFD